jgi:D-3-phosphoglycerate dehydrogenase/C-terminal binding protein
MNVLLLTFGYDDDAVLERKLARGRATLHMFRRGQTAPATLCAKADGVVHYSAVEKLQMPPAAFKRCRIVVRSGVGFDNVDLAGWGRRGVPVCNVPDYGTSEVADHAIALMLALARGTATYQEAVRTDPAGGWRFAAAPAVRRLRGAVFGVVGLGRIGLAAALRARAFGMDVAFHDPYLPSGAEIAVGMRRMKTLASLMAVADVLSVHAPLSAETQGMIGAKALARAKPGMIVINTARGPIVDLAALHRALKSGRVSAAGLDVLEREPADAEHPLIAAWHRRESWLDGRLVITPHAAFYSPASIQDLRTKSLTTVLDCLAGAPAANCVNAVTLRKAR